MCAQCMAGALAAGGAATGLRAWVAAKRPRWLGRRGLQAVTAVLIAGALVLAAGVLA